MAVREWFTTADRTRLNLSTAVVVGVALVDIYHLRISGAGVERWSLFAHQGDRIHPTLLADMQAAQSPDAVPAKTVPAAARTSPADRLTDLQAALPGGPAPLDSPAFTGIPTVNGHQIGPPPLIAVVDLGAVPASAVPGTIVIRAGQV